MFKKISSPFESRRISSCSPSKFSMPAMNLNNMSTMTKIAIGLVVFLIILVLLYNFNKSFKNYVSSFKFMNGSGSGSGSSSKSISDTIKDLGIIFICDPTTEPCKEMIKLFNKEGTAQYYEYIDVTVPEQKEFAEKIGALERGTPNFISKKLGVGFVGPRNSSEDIINTLIAVEQNMKNKVAKENYENENETSGGNQDLQGIQNLRNKLQQLDIIMFKSSTCGHCTRVLEELNSLGLADALTIVEVNGDLAAKYIQQYNLPANGGVPFFYSRVTGKLERGSRPVARLADDMA
jgi:glutaredoxin